MRRVILAGIGRIGDASVREAFKEIQLASAEADLLDIVNSYSITGAFTETRVLNVSAPSTANIAAVLATFITDCKRGGQFRTT